MAGIKLSLWGLAFMLLIRFVHVIQATAQDKERSGGLNFVESANRVTLGNDQIQITLGNGHGRAGFRGSIQSLVYRPGNGTEDLELLQRSFPNSNDEFPGYWDMHWYDKSSRTRATNSKCKFGEVRRTSSIDTDSGETIENRMLGVTYGEQTVKKKSSTPVDTIIHYSVKRGVAGIYSTLLLDHGAEDEAMFLNELRLVLKLNPKLFDYSYVADDRQRFMPTRRDISKLGSSKLAFKEARLITKPENMSHYGEIDHKYIHSVETKDSSLYGWISTELGVGVWIISPNKWEYLGGGPTKQDLSVQTGPKLLSMLQSLHYGTPSIYLADGEEWKKVFGPFLIYVNQAPNIEQLILDAKARAAEESLSWPYQWVPFTEYRNRDNRGIVVGRVVLQQPSNLNHNTTTLPASNMWMGLVDESSKTNNWEAEVKNYQFWNTTSQEGEFTIYNVKPGKYILQSIVHGFLLDSSVLQVVIVEENWVSSVGEIVLRPAQKGPIVWEIGYPDRSAAEFMIPPELKNNSGGAHISTNEFRQYGLWQKFEELYPDEDPVFTIGQSDWTKDWYFAHVLRMHNHTTQREIVFWIDGPVVEGDYTLRIAIAGAHQAAVEVRVNDRHGSPLFDTGPFGKDNALARGGIHGRYHEFSVSLSHMNLQEGRNSIFLRQRRNDFRFNYVMYDYLRLEAPAPTLQQSVSS